MRGLSAVLRAYKAAPPIVWRDLTDAERERLGADTGGYYSWARDEIVVLPGMCHTVTLHELVHSTGHYTRLGRDLSVAREEIVAELGSLILARSIGLTFDENSIHEMIKDWVLRGNVRDMWRLHILANRAVDYILGR